MRSRRRIITDKLIAFVAESHDIRIDIVGAKAQVMQATAALFKVGRDRAAALQWRNELDVRRRHTKKGRRGFSASTTSLPA